MTHDDVDGSCRRKPIPWNRRCSHRAPPTVAHRCGGGGGGGVKDDVRATVFGNTTFGNTTVGPGFCMCSFALILSMIMATLSGLMAGAAGGSSNRCGGLGGGGKRGCAGAAAGVAGGGTFG